MYYTLNEDFLLRGWQERPTGVVKRMAGQVAFWEPEIYGMIKQNGSLPQSSPNLTQTQRQFLDRMVEYGVFELTEEPRSLTKKQQYRFHLNPYIHAVQWAITGNCNCRCRHCYMSAPTGEVGEFSTTKCLDIIRQFEEAGVQCVALTGGDPLMRRDFLELAGALTEADIRISTIMTNGLLVTEELLDALSAMGQRPEFNMSFDGRGRHDWLRGVLGAEEAVTRAFLLCRDHGFPTGAEYCLHKGNLDVLYESICFLSGLGCSWIKTGRMRAEGEGIHIADMCISAQEEYGLYLELLPKLYADRLPMDIMLAGAFYGNMQSGNMMIPCEKCAEDADCGSYYLCGHARNWMHITADGYIVPCIPIGTTKEGRLHFPNITQTDIQTALTDSAYIQFIETRLSDYFRHNPECACCVYRNRCAGGCRGQAAFFGDRFGKDPETCAFFLGGWYEKAKNLIENLKK